MRKFFQYVIVLAPIFFTIYYFLKFQLNVPFADDWSAINGLVIRYNFGNDSFLEKLKLLVAQCNEHREGFVAIVALLQYWVLGTINYSFFNFIGLLGSISLFGVFFVFILKNKISKNYLISIAFILFNASYYHNFYWPLSALQHNSVVFFVILTMYFLFQKKPIYIPIASGALSVFTSANGFLLFIAAIPLIRNYTRKSQIVWAISGVILFLAYMYGYQQPAQRNGLLANIGLIKEIIFTAFTYLGAFSGAFFPFSFPYKIAISAFLGIPILGWIVYMIYQVFFQTKKVENGMLFLASIQLFVLCTVGLYALGRANLPLDAVFESRYGINHAILLVSIVLQIAYLNKIIVFEYVISIFAILFFMCSYFFHSLEINNFNRGNVASIISNQGNHRDFYYYLINGKKVDLTKPTIGNPNKLPKPLVDFTAMVPSSGKYYNDVIQVSLTNGFYTLPDQLCHYYQMISTYKINGYKQFENDFQWIEDRNFIAYHSNQLKNKALSGSDGLYLILRNKELKPILYPLQFQEVDYRNQLQNPFKVSIRKVDGGIPFSVLPNGTYLAQIYQFEQGKVYSLGLNKKFKVTQ